MVCGVGETLENWVVPVLTLASMSEQAPKRRRFTLNCRWHTRLLPELRTHIRSFLPIPARVCLAVSCTQTWAEDPQHVDMPSILRIAYDALRCRYPGRGGKNDLAPTAGMFTKAVARGLLEVASHYYLEATLSFPINDTPEGIFWVKFLCRPFGPRRNYWSRQPTPLGEFYVYAYTGVLEDGEDAYGRTPWKINGRTHDADLKKSYGRLFRERLDYPFVSAWA